MCKINDFTSFSVSSSTIRACVFPRTCCFSQDEQKQASTFFNSEIFRYCHLRRTCFSAGGTRRARKTPGFASYFEGLCRGFSFLPTPPRPPPRTTDPDITVFCFFFPPQAPKQNVAGLFLTPAIYQ